MQIYITMTSIIKSQNYEIEILKINMVAVLCKNVLRMQIDRNLNYKRHVNKIKIKTMIQYLTKGVLGIMFFFSVLFKTVLKLLPILILAGKP